MTVPSAAPDLPEGPVQYFVYYRVRADLDVDDAHAGIRAMQSELERQTGVPGRLLTRLHEESTWMEIYSDVTDPPRFEAALQAAVAAAGLDAYIEDGAARHIERFVECA